MTKFRLVTPYVLAMLVIVAAVGMREYWLLLCLPAIAVGLWCVAPNLNLADGCLVQILAIACFVLGLFLGARFVVPGAVGWVARLAGGIELAVRLGHFSRGSGPGGEGPGHG